MEFMESINAPPYLRFWTNADIFRQFATLAASEEADGEASSSMELMRSDAMCIYDAHFAPAADLPIRLVTHGTFRFHSGASDADSKSVDPRVLEAMHEKIVAGLYAMIQSSPDPDCFKESQALVLRILDVDFVQRFRESKYFQKYCTFLIRVSFADMF
jgi:hypothetical protein